MPPKTCWVTRHSMCASAPVNSGEPWHPFADVDVLELVDGGPCGEGLRQLLLTPRQHIHGVDPRSRNRLRQYSRADAGRPAASVVPATVRRPRWPYSRNEFRHPRWSRPPRRLPCVQRRSERPRDPPPRAGLGPPEPWRLVLPFAGSTGLDRSGPHDGPRPPPGHWLRPSSRPVRTRLLRQCIGRSQLLQWARH